MTRTTTSLAVAAECADALMTARRAKNWLFILLLLFLLAQLALFLLVRFDVLKLDDRLSVSARETPPASVAPPTTTPPPPPPATLPADGTTTSETTVTTTTPPPAPAAPERTATSKATAGEILQYVIPVIDFLGVTLAIVLTIVLLLLVSVMLVGRTMGVSHATSAFVWAAVLAVLLFPWQAFLISRDPVGVSTASLHDPVVAEQPAFKVPGVLYTYAELQADHKFPSEPLPAAILKWGRYVGFPVLAVLVLMMIQTKSSRGLRFALGEADVQVEVTTRNTGADLGV